jgi:prolipoprotein diacylglyceryltransferase
MIASLQLSFDPLLTVGDISLRWDALALVGVLLVAIGVWVLRLREALGDALRFEDVCFVLLGAIPGAVVCGRLVHALDYADSYLAAPLTTLDLGQGSSSLVGAVIGGALSAAYICRLLGGSVGLWADAAAVPMLLAIGLGKLAILLGGAGQGAATDGSLGLSFMGDGPWRSIDAANPAWPSQALEGVWVLLGIPMVLVLESFIGRGRRAGRGIVLLAALLWWLGGRAVVALTWRDEHLLGPFGSEAVATLVALGVVLVALVMAWRLPDPRASSATTQLHQTGPEGPGPIGTADR